MSSDRWKILRRLIAVGERQQVEQCVEELRGVYHMRSLVHTRVNMGGH